MAWAHCARKTAAIAIAATAMALAACAGAGAEPAASTVRPAWFSARSKVLDAKGFPSISAVPRAGAPGHTDAGWTSLGSDLRAEGDAILTAPRSVPADLKDLESFEAEARRAATPPPTLGTPATKPPTP